MEFIRTIKEDDENYTIDNSIAQYKGKPVFGGQIMSNALYSAYDDINENLIVKHLSIHFVKSSTKFDKFAYKLKELHKGSSTMVKTVDVYQGDKLIAHSTISFAIKTSIPIQYQKDDRNCYDSCYYSDSILDLSHMDDSYSKYKLTGDISNFREILENVMKYFEIEIGEKREIKRQYKIKIKTPEKEDKNNICLLTFFSDLFLIEGAYMIINELDINRKISIITTLNHQIDYFLNNANYTQGFIYLIECDRICDNTAVCSGFMFDQDNKNILRTSQTIFFGFK